MAQGLAPEGAAPSPGRYRGADSVDQKPRSFQADTAPRAGPFNLKFLKPLKRPFNLNNRKPKKRGRIPVRGVRPRCFNVNHVNH